MVSRRAKHGGALIALTVELIRRNKLLGDYSFLWCVPGLSLLVLSLWKDGLHCPGRGIGGCTNPRR